MRPIVLFTAMLLLPLLVLATPLIHAGGPFPTVSFQIVTAWLLAISLMLMALFIRNSQIIVPKFLLGPFVASFSIGFLLWMHSDYGKIISWVPVFLLMLTALSISVFLSLIVAFKLNVEGTIGLIAKALLILSSLLCILTLPGSNYLGLGWLASPLQIVYPLTFGGFNQQNIFASFIASVIAFFVVVSLL